MGIWLVMTTSDGDERPFRVQSARTTIIGRETRCDVRIAIPSVSDRHCELRLDGEELHLCDLDSAGGTYHNGERIRRAKLSHADRVTVGPITFEVRMDTSEQRSIELTPNRRPAVSIETLTSPLSSPAPAPRRI
jgi:pSer/pThr/pTyr-binding forkhead associated (FHA) protein